MISTVELLYLKTLPCLKINQKIYGYSQKQNDEKHKGNLIFLINAENTKLDTLFFIQSVVFIIPCSNVNFGFQVEFLIKN